MFSYHKLIVFSSLYNDFNCWNEMFLIAPTESTVFNYRKSSIKCFFKKELVYGPYNLCKLHGVHDSVFVFAHHYTHPILTLYHPCNRIMFFLCQHLVQEVLSLWCTLQFQNWYKTLQLEELNPHWISFIKWIDKESWHFSWWIECFVSKQHYVSP